MLVATMCLATAYKLRASGLFSCDAAGYAADRYVAYCQANAYGDYDYGAFWFGLEPSANAAAATADVLFLGNSRAQFAFSSNAMARWFESHTARYFLLGFGYYGNMAFAGPLLTRLQPRARVYVINVDLFFRSTPPAPAQEVMRDSAALGRYREKRFWQSAHRSLCARLGSLCRHELGYYRSRTNGAWIVMGGTSKRSPAVYSDVVDPEQLEGDVALGRAFLSKLPVSRDCILLTVTPKGAALSGTKLGTAKAIAAALGLRFVSADPPGLNTFDGSHLDRESAERWSAAFMQTAGPAIQKCLTHPEP